MHNIFCSSRYASALRQSSRSVFCESLFIQNKKNNLGRLSCLPRRSPSLFCTTPRPSSRSLYSSAALLNPFTQPNPLPEQNDAPGLRRVLNETQSSLLKDEVALLESIIHLIEKVSDKEDVELLRQAVKQLQELFLLVVVGEFNAGKTAFLNALLGQKFLKEGVTPTTSKVTAIRYGQQTGLLPTEDENREEISLPVEWLKDLVLVDTPGTNAVLRHHQQITEHFVPRSDLVLFITSSDRALSESERIFLENIRQWKKKGSVPSLSLCAH